VKFADIKGITSWWKH